MPLLLERHISPTTRLAIWDVKEEDNFFIAALKLSSEEKRKLELMRPHRKREWLASRYLLVLISDDNPRKEILKSTTGKPFRKACSKHISLSHTKDRVAAIISDKKVGIDIQNEVEKITRIQHKFISSGESRYIKDENKLAYYHIHWGAKESMYKAYGLKELDFKDHMYLYPFEIHMDKLELVGRVTKGAYDEYFDLYCEIIDRYYLVYCILSNDKTIS